MPARPAWPGCRRWVYCRIAIDSEIPGNDCRRSVVPGAIDYCHTPYRAGDDAPAFLRMSTPATKRLSDIRNEFERGVFLSVYHSRPQRLHRQLARILLGLKHGLRGTLFSWPLYLLPLAAWSFKASYLPLMLLLLPGIYLSGIILVRGVREDYAAHVEGFILRPGYPGRLLFPGSFIT